MKIVIDISEEINMAIMRMGLSRIPNDMIKEVDKAIQHGIPLPEHHGRLINADELIQDIIDDNQLCLFNSESERIIHDTMVNFATDRIADADTIIEADKEGENE